MTTVLIWLLCGFIPLLIGRIISKEKDAVWKWIVWTLLGKITLGLFLVAIICIVLDWILERDYSWLTAWLTKKV